MMWRINQACNFSCAYCFREGVDPQRPKEHPECGRYTPAQIADCFDRTGRIWRIHITGGEPFLYPAFIELAEALTQKHRLTINTNLFTPGISDFACRISPRQIHGIYASLHLAELGKRTHGVQKFLDNLLLLQDAGFRAVLNYITYPPLLDRMEKDLENFSSRGIREICIKIFRGWYQGQFYPKSYTPDQKKRLKRLGLTKYEQAILQRRTRFRGRSCIAGSRAFYMDISGNLTRCCTIPKSYGNFLDRQYHFDESPSPCTAGECICPYQGIKFADGNSRRFFAFLRKG